MTTFEIIILCIILVPQLMFSAALLVFAFKRDIHFVKHIITENRIDDTQKEIAKANIEALKRYSDKVEKVNEEQQSNIKNMTEALQDIMGVNDEER